MIGVMAIHSVCLYQPSSKIGALRHFCLDRMHLCCVVLYFPVGSLLYELSSWYIYCVA